MPTELLPLPQGSHVPNSPLPARLYRAAFAGLDAGEAEQQLAERGWTGAWRNGIYPFHHYHSTAHEVLVLVRGWATVTLGGEGGPRLTVRAGDALLLPAGTGHRNDGSSPDLLVVGAYAGGRSWDTLRPETADWEAALTRIAAVPPWAQEPAG